MERSNIARWLALMLTAAICFSISTASARATSADNVYVIHHQGVDPGIGARIGIAGDDESGGTSCTLRDALDIVNAGATSGTVTGCTITALGSPSSPIYRVNLPDYTQLPEGAYTLNGSELSLIANEVHIEGRSQALSIVQASTCDPINLPEACTPATHRVLNNNAAVLELVNMTVRYGNITGDGGGILNENGATTHITHAALTSNASTNAGGAVHNTGSTLHITASDIHSNYATVDGGAVANKVSSTLVVSNSIFSNNSVDGSNSKGGAILVNDSSASIAASTFADNTATNGDGGAINNSTLGVTTVESSAFYGNLVSGSAINEGGAIASIHSLTVNNSTFYNNRADWGGGIENLGGTTTITNSTISGNIANNTNGGGIDVFNGTINISNSIVANNTGGNCQGTITDQGNNFTDNATNCNGSWGSITPGTHYETTPQDNGGPTLTFALLSGSPAIDGTGAACPAEIDGIDQRGAARDATCDAGSYEYDAVPPSFTARLTSLIVFEGGYSSTLVVDAENFTAGDDIEFVVIFAGEAQRGVDYSVSAILPTDNTLTFSAGGATQKAVLLTAQSDLLVEGPETLEIVLAPIGSASLVDWNTQTVVIEETIVSAVASSELEDSGSLSFTLARSGNVDLSSTVAWDVTHGSTDDADFVGGAPSGSLTFAPGDTVKTITVDITADDIAESDESFSLLLHSPENTALGDATASGTIVNDDTASVLVSPRVLSIVEPDGVNTFKVVLTSKPTDDVTITLSPDDPGECTVSDASLSFTPSTWNTQQTVTVTAVDDDLADGDQPCLIETTASSSDPTYNAIDPDDVDVTVFDDGEVPGVVISRATLNVVEGGTTDLFTVRLTSPPTANVELDFAFAAGAPDHAQLVKLVRSTQFVISPATWDQPIIVEVGALDDSQLEGAHSDTLTVTASSTDPAYNTPTYTGGGGAAGNEVTINITDNDVPGLIIEHSVGGTYVTEGGTTDAFTVGLTSQPTATVTVDLSTPGTQVTYSPAQLTFEPGTWDSLEVVTVEAVDDALLEGPHTASIDLVVSSSDIEFDGLTESVTVNVIDDDSVTGNLPPSADAGPDQTVTDADGDGTHTVTLDGSASSDDDGVLISYEWRVDGTNIGSEMQPIVELAVGTHTVTLTVTDDDGATATDTVTVIVEEAPNTPPTADAGPDQTMTDVDGDGTHTVTLDGSASSDADGTLASYEWRADGANIANGVQPTVELAVGTHTVTLTVTDDDGATATDTVTITVEQAGAPVNLLVNGGFEEAFSSGDWLLLSSGNNGDGRFTPPSPYLDEGEYILLMAVNGELDAAAQTVDGLDGTLGDTITLSFNYGYVNLSDDGLIGARLILNSATGEQQIVNCVIQGRSTPTLLWTSFSCEAAAETAYDSITVLIGALGVSSGFFGVDDVQLLSNGG